MSRMRHSVAGSPAHRAGLKTNDLISRAIELRGLKIKMEKLPIPVPYGAGFEGERVRKEDMYVQFGGKYADAFEWLRMRPIEDIADGKIEVKAKVKVEAK